MEGDSQSVSVGLGAGIGGFIALLTIICILWNMICGTWCEKKKVQSTVMLIPIKTQRITKTYPRNNMHNNLTTVTSVHVKTMYPDL